MPDSLILYGSRARGDEKVGSDVDLMLAFDGETIASPREANGVSVHRYSKGWLENEAHSGNLFVYHLAYEGVALEDSDGLLERLKSAFQMKRSYSAEARTAALILRMLIESDWGDNSDAQRRFFWALRTIFICASADVGTPYFSSASQESFTKLGGLARLIDQRNSASFLECVEIGNRALGMYQKLLEPALSGEALKNHLISLGGIASDSVRLVEEQKATEVGGILVYL